MLLAPSARLGAYEIVTLVGAGGMGEVYRARDTRLGRDVAVKILSGGRRERNLVVSAANSGKLMAVLVNAVGSTLGAGAPRARFDTGYVELGHGGLNYHVYAV